MWQLLLDPTDGMSCTRLKGSLILLAGLQIADGLHARADGFTCLAVLFGASGVALGFS